VPLRTAIDLRPLTAAESLLDFEADRVFILVTWLEIGLGQNFWRGGRGEDPRPRACSLRLKFMSPSWRQASRRPLSRGVPPGGKKMLRKTRLPSRKL